MGGIVKATRSGGKVLRLNINLIIATIASDVTQKFIPK